MRDEFPLTPSRELPSRHALAACGGHTVEAQRSACKPEEQPAVTQFEPAWGDLGASLRRAND
jgi:hypothetical protein